MRYSGQSFELKLRFPDGSATRESLALAFDRLYESRDDARRLGRAGYDLMMTLGINWPTVIARLTA